MEQGNTETSLTKSMTTLIKDELESGIKKYLDISSKKQRQYLSNFVTDNFITWEITDIMQKKTENSDLLFISSYDEVYFSIPNLEYIKVIKIQMKHSLQDSSIHLTLYDDEYTFYDSTYNRNSWDIALMHINALLDYNFMIYLSSIYLKNENRYLINQKTSEITKNTLQAFCNKLIVGQWFIYNEFHALYADIKKVKNGEMIQKRIIYQDFIKTPEPYLKEIKIILEP